MCEYKPPFINKFNHKITGEDISFEKQEGNKIWKINCDIWHGNGNVI